MYKEDIKAALPYRRRLLKETNAYIESLRAGADKARADYFKPDMRSPEAYGASVEGYREDFIRMLGRPLSEYPADPPVNSEVLFVCEDEKGICERLWVECAPGLWSYGLLWTPHAAKEGKPLPYVTASHGGLGTPEIVSTLYGHSGNYGDMVQRLRARGDVIVYAPQLLLWGENYDEEKSDSSDHIGYDNKLKQVGGSVAALEIFKIMRTVDWLVANKPIDTAKMGMVGLSYGGFYTLFTAACDTRYKCALSSCFVSDRYKHGWGDWHWFDSASKFLDAEAAGLICPRALCIQVGIEDNLFDVRDSIKPAAAIRHVYESLGLADRFQYSQRPGGHQFSPEDGDLDRFWDWLMK